MLNGGGKDEPHLLDRVPRGVRVHRPCGPVAVARTLPLVGALLLVGCAHQTIVGPSSPNEQYLAEKAREYARFLNVEITVSFGSSPTAAGWVSCGPHNPAIVNFDAVYVDGYDPTPATFDYFDHLAAHEVCHVYYRDYRCEEASEVIEPRANACAEKVVRGIHP